MAELFQKHAHPPRMRTHFDHHMGRWASKEEGPKRLANRLDGFRSFDSAVRPKNAQSALLVSQIASNHRSGTFRHGRSLLAPSSALKPADYLLGLKERPPHPISVGRAACVAQNPHGPRAREPGAAATTRPASPPIEATAIRPPRASLLGVALTPMGGVARGAPRRSPPDRDSLAPARLRRFLDMEVTPRAGRSTTGHLRACRTRAYHGARESALGLATHSRRVAQAGPRSLAAHCCASHAAPPEVTLAPSQTWRTFLQNHLADLVSVDFFVVPTATFRVLYVFVVLLHHRRKVVHFNVTDSPTAAWTAQQIVEAFPHDSAPRYLLRDRDGHLRWRVPATSEGHGLGRGSHCASLALAEPLRSTRHWHLPPRAFRPRHRPE